MDIIPTKKKEVSVRHRDELAAPFEEQNTYLKVKQN